MTRISLIVAIADNLVIGNKNTLPWDHIRSDMLWFKEKTKDKLVLMGSSTWDSLPRKPLPNRTNVVLSSRRVAVPIEGGPTADELPYMYMNMKPESAIEFLKDFTDDEIVIMGGAKVYGDFFQYADTLYVTRVHQTPVGDTFLDIDALMAINGGFTCVESINDPLANVTFQTWKKINESL